jgi:hypothetical protein
MNLLYINVKKKILKCKKNRKKNPRLHRTFCVSPQDFSEKEHFTWHVT